MPIRCLACPADHPVARIGVTCPHCHEIIMVSAVPRTSGGKVLRWPIAVLVISYMVALFLIRHPDALWPAYTFLSLSVVNLFAIIFSKGAVLRTVALASALVVLSWAAWWDSLAGQAAVVRVLPWVPAAIWIATVVYAFFLGTGVRQESQRRPGTLFLVMASFILGLWGVFVVDSVYGLGQGWVRSVALVLIAVAPLAVIVAGIVKEKSAGPVTGTIAALVGAVSGYLTIMEWVAKGLNYALQVLPWRILGMPAIPRVDPGWFVLFGWKTAASAILGAVALAVVVSTTVVAVAHDFPAPADDFLKAHIHEADLRIASQHDAISQIGEHTYRSVLRVTRILFLAVLFMVRVVYNVALVLLEVVKRVLIALLTAIRWFALPVACFSVVSLLILAMAHGTVEYVSALSGAYSAPALWGGLICAAVLVIALCGAAFGLNAVDRKSDLSVNAIAPALLLAWLSYCTMTLAALALWVVGFALRSAGRDVTALSFGPVERLNLLFMTGSLAVIVLPNLMAISFFRQGASATRAPSHVLTIASLACAAVGTAVLALALGHAPIGSWVSDVV